MNDDIVYEPHPVSPERKAELRREGKRIIDARFAPEGAKIGGKATKAKAKAPAKPTEADELRAKLTAAGVDFAADASLEELQVIAEASEIK